MSSHNTPDLGVPGTPAGSRKDHVRPGLTAEEPHLLAKVRSGHRSLTGHLDGHRQMLNVTVVPRSTCVPGAGL
jgi:hypothetical protein